MIKHIDSIPLCRLQIIHATLDLQSLPSILWIKLRPQAVAAIIFLLAAGIGLSLVGGTPEPIPSEQSGTPIELCDVDCTEPSLLAEAESRTLDPTITQSGLLISLGVMFLMTFVYLRYSKSNREADP